MRSIYGAFDQYQSAQNSKHTHRAMCQCARDGYWPGSVAPDGYRKVPAARVGDKTRYVLQSDPERAALIRRIFDLAAVGCGNEPMGVKAITAWLNDHGYRTRPGCRWGIGTVHDILTRTTYIGEHYFNTKSSKTNRARPREEWIAFPVEPLVSLDTFEAVNRNLKARAPNKVAPRVMSSPMLLTGVLYCGDCGAAMTQMTGKSGRYSYYACVNRKRTGVACTTRNLRQTDVESAVYRTLAERVLEPSRIGALIDECIDRMQAQSDTEQNLRKAQKAQSDAEARLKRLYDGIAAGVLDPTEPMLKNQIDGLKLRPAKRPKNGNAAR